MCSSRLKFSKQSSGGGGSGRGLSSKARAKTTTALNVYGRRAHESVLEVNDHRFSLSILDYRGV